MGLVLSLIDNLLDITTFELDRRPIRASLLLFVQRKSKIFFFFVFFFSLFVLVTLLVAVALATNSSNKQFCRMPGTFTPENTESVDTFNRGSTVDAALALCAALTPTALRADSVDCVTSAQGANQLVILSVTEGANQYECRAIVENKSQCRGRGGHNNKRQVVENSCHLRRTKDDCRDQCNIIPGVFNDNCLCYWDSPADVNGHPGDESPTCPEGQQCCWSKPCWSYLDISDCYFKSGGLIDEITGTDSRCAWNTTDSTCNCRTPLVPVPVPTELPIHYPFDCTCPYSPVNTTSPAECAALVPPTQQQSRELRFLNSRFFVTANHLQRTTYVSQCPRDKVRVFFSFGVRVHTILNKVQDRLRNLGVDFATQYQAKFVDFFFYPSQGGRFRAIAEEELSKDELEALSPSEVEYEEVAADDQTAAALSAAAMAAALAVGAL
jgi:hypothetical protein